MFIIIAQCLRSERHMYEKLRNRVVIVGIYNVTHFTPKNGSYKKNTTLTFEIERDQRYAHNIVNWSQH